jgi:hypothetical protein
MTSARTLSLEHRSHVPVDGPTALREFARRHLPRAEEWADPFVLSRELVGAAERGRFYRAVKSGELVRVRPGVYLPAGLRALSSVDDWYLIRLRAEALASTEPLLFGGMSAAALWRLPVIGSWPERPTVFAERATGGRSAGSLERRCEGLPEEVWVVDGLATTGLARTVVDVARFQRFGVAVAMADFALAPKPDGLGALSLSVGRQELSTELAALGLVHGQAKVVAVVDFSDGDSGSAGESISRVVAYRLGFPRPVLQFVFRDHLGEMFADFWWPDYRMIGEFDGHGKYLRDEYTRGRTTAEVVLAEKHREDRLRALGAGVVRWGWAEALEASVLRRTLLAAGLPVLALSRVPR